MIRILLVLALLAGLGASATELPQVTDGDVIFHTSRSSQSVAIQRATASPFSHMGIVFHRQGRPFVLEAISTVRYTPLREWIARGSHSRFVVKRLRDTALLTPPAVARLRIAAEAFLGRRYDLTFEWSDDRIYCSELVWKAYERGTGLKLGDLQQLKDFNLKDPAVRGTLRERYGTQLPLQEPVISPVSMFNSALLTTVVSR